MSLFLDIISINTCKQRSIGSLKNQQYSRGTVKINCNARKIFISGRVYTEVLSLQRTRPRGTYATGVYRISSRYLQSRFLGVAFIARYLQP